MIVCSFAGQIDNCQKVLEILATYESVSRQQINQRKTSLFLSKSTTDGTKIEIKEALGGSGDPTL